MSSESKEIYKILEHRLKEKNISIAEAARLCDLPDSTVRGIIKRKQQSIALEVAFKISKGLGISLEALNGGAANQPKTNADFVFTAYPDEIIKKYRRLNSIGKEKVISYIDGLLESPLYKAESEKPERKVEIIFYGSPASAGTGELYGDTNPLTVTVPATPVTEAADYCVYVKGDSMEPKYFDGDLIFVRRQAAVEEGEIGIFSVNGESFVKRAGHARLISLNEKYTDIEITADTDIYCQGKVIGKLSV